MIYGAGFVLITSDNHTHLYSFLSGKRISRFFNSGPYMSCNASLEMTECCRIYDRPCAQDAVHTMFDIV